MGDRVNLSARDAIIDIGSAATGEKVTVGKVSINIFTGHGSITSLIVPNSSIGSSKTSFYISDLNIKLKPWSIYRGPLHFTSIEIPAPQIDLETSSASSNLVKILDNVDDYASSAANRSSVERLRADSLTITGAKLKGKTYPIPTTFSVTMPNIQMNDLGKSGNGLTPGDFINEFMTQTVNQATRSSIGL